MTYTRENDIVTLEMTAVDFGGLLVLLGAAVASASEDKPRFYLWLKFVNDLNSTNPDFIPYWIDSAPTTPAKS